jgi:hypothetical protein
MTELPTKAPTNPVKQQLCDKVTITAAMISKEIFFLDVRNAIRWGKMT